MFQVRRSGYSHSMRVPKSKRHKQQQWSVGIVVPAHNEEMLIERCLSSLLNIEHRSDLWIVVVADSCSDQTGVTAQSILGDRGEVLEITKRNAGVARSLGADQVLAHFRKRYPSRPVWLANTDADSFVPRHWISQQLELASTGARAIAGVVDIDTFSDFGPGTRERFEQSYGQGSDGDHPHVQAANFGVCASAYLTVGGWPPIALGEDRELWNRLGEKGFKRVADRRVRVVTSGRARGRIPGGFADCLNLLDFSDAGSPSESR
jgi:glycosyltransferase involved in cell wall biosynthesis